MSVRLPKQVQEALDATGRPYAVEHGRRHRKIKVDGRLVGILPLKPCHADNDRASKNIVAQIRRAGKC
ncbi:hypothetical protein J2X38_004066 [Sphingopyxis sp. BE235]|nr:hypothetical protein [Sphingopyxis sp. BE235]MDR7182440.1 hypothetical protein [Sphingopyxis sp. BE249]